LWTANGKNRFYFSLFCVPVVELGVDTGDDCDGGGNGGGGVDVLLE